MIKQLILADLTACWRSRFEMVLPLGFFVIVVSLFPLALSVDPQTLENIAPAIVWVAALLSAIIGLQAFLWQDFHDGFLEQCLVSPLSLPALMLAKVWTHWLITGFPLVILAPLLGKMLYISWPGIAVLVVSLLLGTPILSFIGAVAVALTLGLRNAGVLMTLLVLPLYIPVLIFGTSSVMSASLGMPIMTPLLLLAAILVLAVSFVPLAIAAALRVGLS